MSQGLLFKNNLLSKSKLFGSSGKYDIGDKIAVSDTVEKIASIKVYSNVYNITGGNFYIMGEDTLHIYFCAYSNSLYWLRIYNKQTGVYSIGTDNIQQNYPPSVCGGDDGFVYVYIGNGSKYRKVNCTTGDTIWSCSSSTSSYNSPTMKVIDNVLYAYFFSNTSVSHLSINTATGIKINEDVISPFRNSFNSPFIDGTNIYFSDGAGARYKYDIATTSLISNTVSLSSSYNVDDIGKICYVPDNTSIKAYDFNNNLLWTYYHNLGYIINLLVMQGSGVVIEDNQTKTKLSLKGTVLYTFRLSPLSLIYNYAFNNFAGITYDSSNYNYYFKVYENLTIAN